MIPSELKEVILCLKKNKMILQNNMGDGRQDSSTNENKVIQTIQNANLGFKVTAENLNKNNNRNWFDATIAGYYVNIKISALKSADNTSAKPAIFYFLTGQTETPTHTKQYWEQMKQNESPDENRNYFYLIVNKDNPSDVFCTSLKGLKTVNANGSEGNYPFQCVWDENRELADRTWAEAKIFLLTQFAKSVTKTISKLSEGLPCYYPEIYDKVISH
ncbi:MAG: hypothetical protein QM538_03630 [Methylacidiphilales bacterium]|nr:hypothetical protein [Candidatus Methylacidiphilales bacterium]